MSTEPATKKQKVSTCPITMGGNFHMDACHMLPLIKSSKCNLVPLALKKDEHSRVLVQLNGGGVIPPSSGIEDKEQDGRRKVQIALQIDSTEDRGLSDKPTMKKMSAEHAIMSSDSSAYYCRPRGDRAKAFEFLRPDDKLGEDDYDDTDEPSIQEHMDIRHGDLLYRADAFRGSDTWVVVGDNTFYLEKLVDDAGYAYIDQSVSCMIEDPVDFYSEVSNKYLRQGVAWILFDEDKHPHFILQYALNDGKWISDA